MIESRGDGDQLEPILDRLYDELEALERRAQRRKRRRVS
jgi:hypothetical protein